MRTCDLLASAERQRGQLAAAAAWYGRSHELAEQLGDRKHLAVVAQNRGILYQTQAEQSDDPARRARLGSAARRRYEEVGLPAAAAAPLVAALRERSR